MRSSLWFALALILCVYTCLAVAPSATQAYGFGAVLADGEAQAEADVSSEAAAEKFKFKDLWKKIKDPLKQIGKDKLKDLIDRLADDEAESEADAEADFNLGNFGSTFGKIGEIGKSVGSLFGGKTGDTFNKIGDTMGNIGKIGTDLDNFGKLFGNKDGSENTGSKIGSIFDGIGTIGKDFDSFFKGFNGNSGSTGSNGNIDTASPTTGSTDTATGKPKFPDFGSIGDFFKNLEDEEINSDVYGLSEAGSISVEQLRKIIPSLSSSKAQAVISYLNNAMQEGNINTCARQAAFIAQTAHESGGLQWFEEFASGAAYEGRKDLCNTHAGDGKRFKGRGPIQLTGRCNYTNAGKALGLDLVGNPAQVATYSVGFRTSVWFWSTRSLNSYADQNTQSSFDTITRRINGGLNGKADRDQYWRRAKNVLGC